MPQGWHLGVLGIKNLSVGICNGAPSTARSGLNYNNQDINEPSHDIQVLIKLSIKDSAIV